jgi:hypothetical protein
MAAKIREEEMMCRCADVQILDIGILDIGMCE